MPTTSRVVLIPKKALSDFPEPREPGVCKDACSGHGNCVAEVDGANFCICDSGFGGDACQVVVEGDLISLTSRNYFICIYETFDTFSSQHDESTRSSHDDAKLRTNRFQR